MQLFNGKNQHPQSIFGEAVIYSGQENGIVYVEVEQRETDFTLVIELVTNLLNQDTLSYQ
jgi:hypothetical protein